MKNKHLPLIASLFGVFAMTSCGSKTVTETVEGSTTKDVISSFESIPANIIHEKEYFALKDYNVVFYEGGATTKQIEFASIPASISASGLTFTSEDENIATVTKNGLIEAKSTGITKIFVKSADNSVNQFINVAVNSTISNQDARTKLVALDNAVKSPEHQELEKFRTNEYVKQTLAANGKIYNSSEYVQEMKFSKSDVYFEIYSDDIYIKTEGGDPELASGRWTFFLDKKSYHMFLCHDTPYAKNYMNVNCMIYTDDIADGIIKPYQIMYDLLDMFFVAGSDIVSGTLADIEGNKSGTNTTGIFKDFIDFIDKGYDNVTYRLGSCGEKDLSGSYTLTQEDEPIENGDEEDLCIPAGTLCDYAVNDDVIIKDSLVIGENYLTVMDYEIDLGDGLVPGQRTFQKNIQNFTDFEIKLPDISEYSLKDSLYDL